MRMTVHPFLLFFVLSLVMLMDSPGNSDEYTQIPGENLVSFIQDMESGDEPAALTLTFHQPVASHNGNQYLQPGSPSSKVTRLLIDARAPPRV